MKYKLIASAGSKQDLEKLINDFYFSTNYIITDDNKLYNDKFKEDKNDNINNNSRILYKKNRWRYEILINQ